MEAGGLEVRFSQSRPVLEFVQQMVRRRCYFVGALRRELSRLLLARCGLTGSERVETRPDGSDVEAMVGAHPEIFGAGEEALPPGSHRLKPQKMLWWHSSFCAKCHWSGSPEDCVPDPSCYFAGMLECIERGWHPPFYTDRWVPPYGVEGNYKTTDLYKDGVGSMLLNKAIVKCQPSKTQIVHPVGAVVKASDKMQARALLGQTVIDQHSMALANEKLIDMGLPKIKVRVTMDCTATGANGAVHSVHFT